MLRCICVLCLEPSRTKVDLCAICAASLTCPMPSSLCMACGILLPESKSNICGRCQCEPFAFDSVFAPFRYDAKIAYLVKQLKFAHKLYAGRILSHLFLQKLISNDLPEAIIAVPLHKKRLRERGFNQALEIIKPIAKTLNIPVIKDSVIRTKHTLPQSKSALKVRAKNLKNAFATQKNLNYQYVAIFDDVMTTGATVNSLAQCLKQKGVKRVDVWCVARAQL